jgi:hypothetical protein
MKWLRQLFSRRRQFSELSDEIQEHLAENIEELVEGGMSREEATHAARREFGNVTLVQEDSRAVWRWLLIENLVADIRYGLRILRKDIGFTVVAVSALALGIGVNTAVFTAFDAVLLRPRAVSHPERLVRVLRGASADSYGAFSYSDYVYFRDHSKTFSDLILVASGLGVAMLAAGFLAAYLPARLAMRVDPMVALRYE